MFKIFSPCVLRASSGSRRSHCCLFHVSCTERVFYNRSRSRCNYTDREKSSRAKQGHMASFVKLSVNNPQVDLQHSSLPLDVVFGDSILS